jgi:hypothetical protein
MKRWTAGGALLAAATALTIAGPAAPAFAAAPEDGTIIRLSDGTYLPIMKVTGSATVDAVGYRLASGYVQAYDQDGTLLWSASEPNAVAVNGGYDYDSDGFPDVGVVIQATTGSTCGSDPLLTSTVYFYSGASGSRQTPLSPMNDKCWSFPGTTYPTHQWSELAPLWGDDTNALFAAPYYADTGWYLGYSSGSFSTLGALYYPSTSAYDATYTNSVANTYPTGTDYILNSHVANGLLTEVSGQDRAVFWTSGRVVQYSIGALSASQLIADKPYLTGGRTDIAGRNYGLVSVDPKSSSTIALLSGTSNYSLFLDAKNGTRAADQWGGIERHVSIYNASANTVDDRFLSYAHDNSDGNKYQYRLSYPANPWVERSSGASRLAYNVFHDGRWRLYVSQPGSTTSLYELDDVFLWDIIDLDGDGVDEWLISPTRYTSDPLGPDYYMPKWQTSSYHWNESTLTLSTVTSFSGVIPYLAKSFTRANTSSSDGYLTGAQVYVDSGARKVLMMDSSGAIVTRTP